MKRIDSLLLAGLGVLIAHQISYSVTIAAGEVNTVAHGHLGSAWLIATIGAVFGLAYSVSKSLQRRGHVPPPTLLLATQIAAGYTGLEFTERAIDGNGFSLFTESVYWLGLAVAPTVAAVLSWLIGRVQQLVAELVPASTPVATPVEDNHPDTAPTRNVGLEILLFSLSRRGPPSIA